MDTHSYPIEEHPLTKSIVIIFNPNATKTLHEMDDSLNPTYFIIKLIAAFLICDLRVLMTLFGSTSQVSPNNCHQI